MKVICINKNGWYLHDGSLHNYLAPNAPTPNVGDIDYGQIVTVVSSFVCKYGDLIYNLSGYNVPYNSEGFGIIESEIEKISLTELTNI